MGSNTPTYSHLDPHEAPPQELKEIYKSWNSANALTEERLRLEILDAESLKVKAGTEAVAPQILQQHLEEFLASNGFQTELDGRNSSGSDLLTHYQKIAAAYEIDKLPGLFVFPSLLPPKVQQSLLCGLLHRELSNPENQTNLHLHYKVSYPPNSQSFFSVKPENAHQPKDSETHKPLSNRAILEKSLHWVTFGGQYDWTKKQYPAETPPQFPPAVGKLISALFPDMKPQAAILNVYSPKDKLSLHRDVSEEVDRGLVSISLGCSCLFIIGLKDKISGEIQHETILLRSGDVLYMSGESRYAWHGVPKIIPDTCPEYLESWPGKEYPEYEGWMKKRRINLNVRQMYE